MKANHGQILKQSRGVYGRSWVTPAESRFAPRMDGGILFHAKDLSAFGPVNQQLATE